MFDQVIYRDAVSLDDIEDAIRHTRDSQQFGEEHITEGSFSDGFRMNVLPQAIALANIHIGTMAGKLNGVIPATTPRG